ncbi:MAG TPA: hypothetical protein VGH23_16210 [Rhizomicrobium sp.]|jgi:hypothetical protein
MPFDWEGLAAAPCMDAFGEPVTYLPSGGGSLPIEGIFDKAYSELVIDEAGSGITTVIPVLGILLSALPSSPRQGDKLQVASVNTTYIVKEVRPDGHAMYKLMLNKVSSP